jgi:hypothetical protein
LLLLAPPGACNRPRLPLRRYRRGSGVGVPTVGLWLGNIFLVGSRDARAELSTKQ